MNKVITVRPAGQKDMAAVDYVSKLAQADLRKVYHPNQKALEMRKEIIGGFTSILAETGGEVIGTLKYVVENDGIRVLDLGVHPSFRKIGVATELIKYLAKIGFDHKQLARISLWTVKETGNVGIFRKMGFSIVSEEESKIFESAQYPFLTEVLLEYRLRQALH